MSIPNELVAPLLSAAISVPVFVVALLVGRGHLHLINGLDADRVADPDGLARRLSLLLSLVGLSIFASAGGFYWAGDDEGREATVAFALVLAVSALAIGLVLAVSNARRDYRDPPKKRR